MSPSSRVDCGECPNATSGCTAGSCMKAQRLAASNHVELAAGYDELRRALMGLPSIQPWFVVGAPWGEGDWVVAGHQDPHVGTRVCDTEDFDGECPESLEYAAYIAAANPATVNKLLQQLDAAMAKIRAEQARTAAAEDARAAPMLSFDVQAAPLDAAGWPTWSEALERQVGRAWVSAHNFVDACDRMNAAVSPDDARDRMADVIRQFNSLRLAVEPR